MLVFHEFLHDQIVAIFCSPKAHFAAPQQQNDTSGYRYGKRDFGDQKSVFMYDDKIKQKNAQKGCYGAQCRQYRISQTRQTVGSQTHNFAFSKSAINAKNMEAMLTFVKEICTALRAEITELCLRGLYEIGAVTFVKKVSNRES